MKITKDNLETYLKGSLFLGTGGGLPYNVHKKIFNNILKNTDEINVTSLDNLNDKDILVSAYGIGDPSNISRDFSTRAIEGFEMFQKLTNLKIKGIIPGEIGAEGLAFQIGSAVNLPVIDSDLVGGRAAPEVQLDVFSVFDLDITPVLLLAMNGESLFLEKKYDAIEIEKISRKFFNSNGSSGILIGYGISAGLYKEYAMLNTLSTAMQMGEALNEKNTDILASKMSANIVYRGMIMHTALNGEGGFLVGEIEVESGVMKVKNENIVFNKKNGKSLTAPDVLMFVDEKFNPIHNTKMKEKIGLNVMLLHISAQDYWQKKEAKRLWKI